MPDAAKLDLSANKIFVLGLTADNKAEVKAYFQVYGTVLALKPLRRDFRMYGWPSPGAGFVIFKSAEAAQAALHDRSRTPPPSLHLLACKPKAKKTVNKYNTSAQVASTSSTRNKRRLGYWQRHSSNDAKPCVLADVIQEAPKLLEFLPSESWSALSGCSRQLRRLVHSHTQVIHIDHFAHLSPLSKGTWPRLSLVKYKTDENNFCSEWMFRKGRLQVLAGFELSLKQQQDWNPSVIFAVRSKPAQHRALPPAILTSPVLNYLQQPKWSDLAQLALKYCNLSLDGLRQLVAIKWPKLHRLNLAGNALGPQGIAKLLLGVWPELRALDISKNKLDSTATEHLVRCQWPMLKELRLDGNPDLDAAAFACLPTAKWPMMNQLQISEVQLDHMCLRELAQSKWKLLTSLSLMSAGMTSAAFAELVQADWHYLRHLDLSHNQLGTKAIAKLVEMQLPFLEDLRLEDNKLDAAAAKQLAKGQWPALSYLVLTHNYLDDAAMLHLGHGQWPTLQALQLRSNNITALGIEFLLSGDWVLRQLELGRAAISAKTWQLLTLDVEQMALVAELTEHEIAYVRRAAVPGSDESLIWPTLTKVEFYPHPGHNRKDQIAHSSQS